VKTEGVMTIKVKGITQLKGNLMLAIFDQAEGFGTDVCAVDKKVIKVVQLNQEIKLTGLVEGKKYGIALYHDVNSNARLDKNFLGIPTEKYGFSNDARNTFGPPSFESAGFYFSDGKVISITLQ
jgi:uncharacterized protein (DUF2141 family)